MSALIWGSGQIFNQQKLKGLFFFSCQLLLILLELFSGHYFSPDFHWRQGGVFVRGIWGVITLGTEPSVMTLDGLAMGDHSLMLLIQGLIGILLLLFFMGLWLDNVRDAYATAKGAAQSGVRISSRRWLEMSVQKSFAYFVMFPAMVMIIFFTLMPLILSFLIAFTNYNINNMPPASLIQWRGLQNFRTLLAMDGIPGGAMWLTTFLQLLAWTFIQAVILCVIPFSLGLLQAVLINNKRIKFKKIFRSLLVLPWAIPGMLSLINFRHVFNGTFGPLNHALLNWGIIDSNISWLGDVHNIWLPRMTIVLIGIWLGTPYWMAMSSGVMTSISKDIYEAAEMDGANEFQQFWKITFPLTLSSLAPILLLSFSGAFNNFGLIYFLTEGGPHVPGFIHAGGTDILITWIFNLTMSSRMYNMASVMSIFIFFMIAGISLWQLPKTRAFKEDV